jgi:hypothetical protein
MNRIYAQRLVYLTITLTIVLALTLAFVQAR